MSKRFKEKIVDGQVFFDNLTPRLTDMPQLTADHTALGTALAQARDLESRREAAKADVRGLNGQRLQTAEQAADLRRRLTDGLRSVLGADSPQLTGFGAKPLGKPAVRVRLTATEKAVRAAARAAAKAAALEAQQPPPTPVTPPAKAATT